MPKNKKYIIDTKVSGNFRSLQVQSLDTSTIDQQYIRCLERGRYLEEKLLWRFVVVSVFMTAATVAYWLYEL